MWPAVHHNQPRSQYTNMPTYSLTMERLADNTWVLGCQNENAGSSGTTNWGGELAGIASTSCLRNTPMARGMCRAEARKSVGSASTVDSRGARVTAYKISHRS